MRFKILLSAAAYREGGVRLDRVRPHERNHHGHSRHRRNHRRLRQPQQLHGHARGGQAQGEPAAGLHDGREAAGDELRQSGVGPQGRDLRRKRGRVRRGDAKCRGTRGRECYAVGVRSVPNGAASTQTTADCQSSSTGQQHSSRSSLSHPEWHREEHSEELPPRSPGRPTPGRPTPGRPTPGRPASCELPARGWRGGRLR